MNLSPLPPSVVFVQEVITKIKSRTTVRNACHVVWIRFCTIIVMISRTTILRMIVLSVQQDSRVEKVHSCATVVQQVGFYPVLLVQSVVLAPISR
jgi:hypothetical protein